MMNKNIIFYELKNEFDLSVAQGGWKAKTSESLNFNVCILWNILTPLILYKVRLG